MPPAGPRACGSLRGVFWPLDALQRAATAIRETRSNDCMVLARKALEGAIRDEDDLLALLPKASTRYTGRPLLSLA
jgi:hypothetical protein